MTHAALTDEPRRRRPPQRPPAIEPVVCDLCGDEGDDDNALTFDRTRSIVAVVCEDCLEVIADETA